MRVSWQAVVTGAGGRRADGSELAGAHRQQFMTVSLCQPGLPLCHLLIELALTGSQPGGVGVGGSKTSGSELPYRCVERQGGAFFARRQRACR